MYHNSPIISIILGILYFVVYYYITMLKGAQKDNLEFLQKPRKLIKINVRQDDNYNEFKGDYLQEKDQAFAASLRSRKIEPEVQFSSLQDEKNRDKGIFQLIKSNTTPNRKIRSLADAKKIPQTPVKQEEKKPVTIQPKKVDAKSNPKSDKKEQSQSKKPQKAKQQATGLSNWQKFLTNASTTPKNVKPESKHDQFVAIDCEFVKHNDTQLLARVSIVNEHGQCKLDTYVHPDQKITDYVTNISGITYGHIKNAPNMKTVINSIKTLLYNKIVVGHTLWKDLQVCGLKDWKGPKAVIDISEFTPYQQKSGKLVSLKNLCTRFLGKKIQQGQHSSTEDANATMSLFLLKKKEILKHFKLIA